MNFAANSHSKDQLPLKIYNQPWHERLLVLLFKKPRHVRGRVNLNIILITHHVQIDYVNDVDPDQPAACWELSNKDLNYLLLVFVSAPCPCYICFCFVKYLKDTIPIIATSSHFVGGRSQTDIWEELAAYCTLGERPSHIKSFAQNET